MCAASRTGFRDRPRSDRVFCAFRQPRCPASNLSLRVETAARASHLAISPSSNLMKMPSPCTCVAGTHSGAFLQREARGGLRFGSPDSSGASTRVNPRRALTSRKRSKSRTLRNLGRERWRCIDPLAQEMRPIGWRVGIGQHVPFGALDICVRHAGSGCTVLDRLHDLPNDCRSIFFDARQSAVFFKVLTVVATSASDSRSAK